MLEWDSIKKNPETFLHAKIATKGRSFGILIIYVEGGATHMVDHGLLRNHVLCRFFIIFIVVKNSSFMVTQRTLRLSNVVLVHFFVDRAVVFLSSIDVPARETIGICEEKVLAP